MQRVASWHMGVMSVLFSFPIICFSVGVNWGRQSSQPLPAPSVASLLRSNYVSKVKLFDVDPLVMESLSGSKIDVMVGIPNEMLKGLNSSKKAAADWVHNNITRYMANPGGAGGVRIKYIAVGSEPFLQSYGEQYKPFVVGAVLNIQLALVQSKLAEKVKVVVPCNFDIIEYDPNVFSKAHFRADANMTMIQLLSFLFKYESPFVVNINPFLVLQRKNISIVQSLLQPASHQLKNSHDLYNTTFDSCIDAVTAALLKSGFSNVDIIVGQIGWPTDGAVSATPLSAQAYLTGLLDHLRRRRESSLSSKMVPKETYFFSLLDEDQRSIVNGNYERHWGIFTFDGQAKYKVDLGQGTRDLVNAQNIEYLELKWCVVDNNKDLSMASASASEACSSADCTALLPGGSCSNISFPGNASYAFNKYYQQHDQSAVSCNFSGLGLITTVDPSIGQCRFLIGIDISFSSSHYRTCLSWLILSVAVFLPGF